MAQRVRRALGPTLEQRHAMLVGTIIGAAAALRFSTLSLQSFWYDETVTVSLLHRSLPAMLRAIPGSETAPPLYYVVAWLWVRVFGFGEVPLRALSAVAGTATVPVSYSAARVLFGQRVAIAVAGLAASSPLLVWYSQEARAYSLLVFFSALSFLFFART